MRISTFGITKDNQEAHLVTLNNKNGMEITLTDMGATLVKVILSDKNGEKRDLVLGYETLQEYEKNTNTYFGATVGRSANRIENATFSLDGNEYQMIVNERNNNLHSGPNGYQIRLWDMEQKDENVVKFTLNSPDGDQGFPGNLTLCVTYQLTENNEIRINYQGNSDKNTIFNVTNHSYFNLGGHDSGSVEAHDVKLFASAFTPVKDSASIPTGEIISVSGTPMDFLTSKKIGDGIDADFEQLNFAGGYDHNFVIDNYDGSLKSVACVSCEETGITMEVESDLPGVQFYAGNFINHEIGKSGVIYEKRNGFCLETQYFPNAINQKGFDKPVLSALEEKVTETIYRFKLQ